MLHFVVAELTRLRRLHALNRSSESDLRRYSRVQWKAYRRCRRARYAYNRTVMGTSPWTSRTDINIPRRVYLGEDRPKRCSTPVGAVAFDGTEHAAAVHGCKRALVHAVDDIVSCNNPMSCILRLQSHPCLVGHSDEATCGRTCRYGRRVTFPSRHISDK